MNYDRIDALPGGGNVWQGGQVDAEINAAPFSGPLLVVAMDRGEHNEQFIDHEIVEAVLAVWIEDAPDACLKDSVLQNLAAMIVSWLDHAGDVYLHCLAGISRASYIDIAVHCVALDVSADRALELIRAERPIADPNSGFIAQLRRLWP